MPPNVLGPEVPVNFELSQDQEAIREAIAKVCARFGDDYWLTRDR